MACSLGPGGGVRGGGVGGRGGDASSSSLEVFEVIKGAVMFDGSVAGAGQATDPPTVT
ncbi:MAG: hypothetical protein GY845_09300 [Planctomycetes bacterium]|nr:hypothetical protein [Planctomycetota bacterium]